MNLKSRIDKIEQVRQPEKAQQPNNVIIYDANIPGDADRKAAEHRKQYGQEAPVFLIPDNGRDRQ